MKKTRHITHNYVHWLKKETNNVMLSTTLDETFKCAFFTVELLQKWVLLSGV